MIDPFYLAAIPEPRTLLGVRLRPLSLGHIILLNRVASAYVCGGNPDFSDLALSVLLCASTYKEGLDHLCNPDLSQEFKRWAQRLTNQNKLLVRLGFRKPTPIDFQQKSEAFIDYLSEGSKIPRYDFNPSDFTEVGCPSAQLVKVSLMREMKFSEDEILDRSWALCLWDFVTLRAISGSVKMYNQESIDDALKLANDLAAKLNGRTQCPS